MNMMGAVSPAARETCRMTPVRIPEIEFGSTTRRMVCQRVQPSAELYYNLAKAELRAGQMVRARVATQNALGIDPQQQPSTHLLSQLPASATPNI